MGVFRRPDSEFWYLWLPTAPKGKQRQKTDIPVGFTAEDRKESKQKAQAVYLAEMMKLGEQRHGLHVEKPAITFAAYAMWFDAHVVAHHRGAEREREILKTLIAQFGGTPVSAITKTAVMEWRSARATATSASNSNRELDVLKQLLTTAVPEYLDASPIAGLARLRPAHRETRVLTIQEEARLLGVLPPTDQALIICAIDTLMRLSDVVNLRRDHDRGTYLVVEDPKVQHYKVPVSSRLRKALDALPKKGKYYFGHRRLAKKARDYRSSVSAMLERACAAVRPKIPFGRKQRGLTFHALRHTGTTRLIEAGVPVRIIQDIGGWKSSRQLERYGHPSEAAKQAAVETIGAAITPAARPSHQTKRKKAKN